MLRKSCARAKFSEQSSTSKANANVDWVKNIVLETLRIIFGEGGCLLGASFESIGNII
jgi:hypothetical protein